MSGSVGSKDYTSAVPPPSRVECEVIGYVRSPFRERFAAPLQPALTGAGGGVEASIELCAGRRYEEALEDLAGFDFVWAITWMHLNRGWNPKVLPPRGPRARRGLFATRSPHRPNPIALSALRLLAVEGLVLRVRGADLLDGTPVLDLKPYLPYADAHPDAAAGWADEIGSGEAGGLTQGP